VLVEQPGGWGRDAPNESALPPEIARHLHDLSRTLPARVLLIRRSGGGFNDAPHRTLMVGVSRVDGGGWLERLQLSSIEALVDVDLRALSAGTTVGGLPVDEPTYLVCTNGKHDVCCATYGLPVARALAGTLGDRVWECSHVGGDRFAGNLVCLPDGIFYGHLDPDTAAAAVAAHEAGRLLPAVCRGRSALSFAAQAAELLVREQFGIDQLDGLRYLDSDRDGDLHRVRFATTDGRVMAATVRQGRDARPRMLTCGTAPTTAPTHELVDLHVAT
jgi:hypothetical protein